MLNVTDNEIRQEVEQTPTASMRILCWAVCVIGLLAVPSALPTAIKAPAALIFVFSGPGLAVLIWSRGLPRYVLRPLVPTVSVAVCILVNYVALLRGLWHPQVTLALLIAASAASAELFRRRELRTRVEGAPA